MALIREKTTLLFWGYPGFKAGFSCCEGFFGAENDHEQHLLGGESRVRKAGVAGKTGREKRLRLPVTSGFFGELPETAGEQQ